MELKPDKSYLCIKNLISSSHCVVMGKRQSKSKSSIVNKTDLKFLKENTNFDEETIEKFYLCFLQDSVDGKMSKEEFSSKFQNSFCSGRSNEDFSSHLFDALDTDQNGYFDFRKASKQNRLNGT